MMSWCHVITSINRKQSKMCWPLVQCTDLYQAHPGQADPTAMKRHRDVSADSASLSQIMSNQDGKIMSNHLIPLKKLKSNEVERSRTKLNEVEQKKGQKLTSYRVPSPSSGFAAAPSPPYQSQSASPAMTVKTNQKRL